jgi:hypothetical protein
MPLAISVFNTELRREINRLIKELKSDMSFEKVFDICSVILFWLLVASTYSYDLILVLG